MDDAGDIHAENRLFFRLDRTRGNAMLFRDRIAALAGSNRMAAAVDVHPADDYERMDLYLTDDGRAGFAIEDGDELVSVFSYRGEHAGDAIVAKAVEMGARRLDCYDINGKLPNLYGAHGFRPVARVKWDDGYAPAGWNTRIMGRPDVVAMSVTGTPPEHVPYVDYDTAVNMARDACARA